MKTGAYAGKPLGALSSPSVGALPPLPIPPTGAEQILSLALATTQGLRDLRRAQAQALGLSPAAFALLETLAQGPEHGMQVSEAASVLGVRPQALSGLAAQLAGQGWLAREIDPADGRARRLSLTPQGRANLAPAHELRQVLAAKLDSLMPNPTLAKLVFRKFLQAIKESRI